MLKKILLTLFLMTFVVIAQPVMAEESAGGGGISLNSWIAIACGFGLAIASAVCGIAQSNAIRSAADGIARNPGSADAIRGMLIIGLAFIESLVIYVLLIALILLFAKWA